MRCIRTVMIAPALLPVLAVAQPVPAPPTRSILPALADELRTHLQGTARIPFVFESNRHTRYSTPNGAIRRKGVRASGRYCKAGLPASFPFGSHDPARFRAGFDTIAHPRMPCTWAAVPDCCTMRTHSTTCVACARSSKTAGRWREPSKRHRAFTPPPTPAAARAHGRRSSFRS